MISGMFDLVRFRCPLDDRKRYSSMPSLKGVWLLLAALAPAYRRVSTWRYVAEPPTSIISSLGGHWRRLGGIVGIVLARGWRRLRYLWRIGVGTNSTHEQMTVRRKAVSCFLLFPALSDSFKSERSGRTCPTGPRTEDPGPRTPGPRTQGTQNNCREVRL